MAVTDLIFPDSPTNTFCTLNPLDDDFNSSVKFTYGEGNLKVSYSFTGTAFQYVFGSLAIPSNSTQKYYWEWTYNDINNNAQHQVGICASDSSQYTPSARTTGTVKEANVGTLRYHSTSQPPYLRYITESSTTSEGTQIGTMSTSATYNNLSVLSLMYDAGAGKLYGWLNGEELAGQNLSTNTSLWDAFDTSKTYMIMLFEGDGGSSTKNGWVYLNYGQDPTFGGTKSPSSTYSDANGIGSFYYQPPTGALALCTANLLDPAIDPNVDDLLEDYMKAVAYSGSIGNDQLVDCGFPADLIWIKGRTASYNTAHMVYDTIRGRTSVLQTQNTDDELDYGNLAPTISTASTPINGFKTPPSVNNNISASANTYVAWFFRAGGSPSGSTSTTGSAKRINTSGTQDDTSCSVLASAATSAGASNVITPTLMSINQKAGFSIFKVTKSAAQYSYDTYPHGLSKAPDFIITKSLNSSTEHWYCYHSSITPNTGYSARIQLNQPNQATLNSTIWGSPTNITDNIIAWDGAQNLEQIFYCWHSVAGYSAFGSYTGNGSPDGPFVYTGFKPAWVMVKRVNGTESWTIFDNARDPYNLVVNRLHPNLPDAETTGSATAGNICLDFYSNSFKLRNTSANINGSELYIYAAFAEQPVKYSNAR